MTIPKRDKKKRIRREVKAPASPPTNKAILEPVGTKKTRRCDYCTCITDKVYCPRCGKVTNYLE